MDKTEKALHNYESPKVELLRWENDVLATGLSTETGGDAQGNEGWYGN